MPRHVRHTQPSFAVRWSSWSALAGIQPSLPASSSRPRSRSATGWRKPTGRRAARRKGQTAFLRLSVRNWPGCGVRTSSCVGARHPLSSGRLVRTETGAIPPGLRIHERAPGHLSGCRDGARARRVGVRVSCVAVSPAIGARHRGHGAAEADPHRPRQLARDVWCAAGAGRAQGRRREAWAQAHRPTDARGRARRRQPPALRGADHAAGQGSQTRPYLVDRNFVASRPNQLWVADITFVPTASGFLYLAVVLDAWSRKLVGCRWPIICAPSWCWTRWKWRAVSAGRTASSITATKAARANQLVVRNTTGGMLRWQGDGGRIERYGTS